MERLAREPRNFKECVEADLRRAARLIIKIQDELDPQFRIATPEGDYWIALTLPPDDYERTRAMQAVGLFMAAKLAPSFILATELKEPDCICAVGISRTEVVMCTAHIRRRPRPWSAANFSQVEWWPRSSLGSELLDLLPKGARTITEKDVHSLDAWFGVNGKFPAMHIASGASSNI